MHGTIEAERGREVKPEVLPAFDHSRSVYPPKNSIPEIKAYFQGVAARVAQAVGGALQ
jgi:hypothetical protein